MATDKANTTGNGRLNVNIKEINWDTCVHSWCYGIRRFYEKQDIVAPESSNVQLLSKNQLGYFHDINFAVRSSKLVLQKTNELYF
jgi:hypothetical protein